MANIQAVVFDIDGTLLDTREFIFRAYEYAIAKHGYPVPNRSLIADQAGRRIEECYAVLVPDADVEALIADHIAFQNGHIDLTYAFDGAEQLVAELKAKGLKVVLWTSRRAHVVTALERCGFAQDSFDAIVDATMVDVGKPDPQGLFFGLGIVNVDPAHAVMVGDAPVDIDAGKRAGVAATIAVTHGFSTRDQLVAAGPDYIVDSLPELSPIVHVLANIAEKDEITNFPQVSDK